MPYESFCHTCNRPFSKTLAPTEYTEYKEGTVSVRALAARKWSRHGFTLSRLSRARKQLE
jgi:hypothetical protein